MAETAREVEEYGRGYLDGRAGRDPAPPFVDHLSVVRAQRRLLNAYREGYEAGADDRRLAADWRGRGHRGRGDTADG